MKYNSIGHMFFSQAREYSEKSLFRHKINKRYQSITWGSAEQSVRYLMSALHHYGVKTGDRVAILSENRVEWPLVDIAVLSLGAIDVPLYPTHISEQCRYVIKHSGASTIVVSSQKQLAKIIAIPNFNEMIKRIIVLNELPSMPRIDGVDIVYYKDVFAIGKKHYKEEFITQAVEAVYGDLIATIIYTSGTTSDPKGACLTHFNLLYNAHDGIKLFNFNDTHTYLSFLPLSHVFERTAGLYVMLMAGAEIAYAEAIETVAPNMLEVKPTIMLGVPRFFNKLYERIQDAISRMPPLKRLMINFAIDTRASYDQYLDNHQTPPLILQMAMSIWNALVFRKLHSRLGGRLQFFVSGGGPLSPDIAAAFKKYGVTIYQGYGLTETSPVVSANTAGANKAASVGKPIARAEVKIAEDGEILVRGAYVMQGYYNDPDATNAAMTPDGWLKTGDIGRFDKDGYLYITDRKKDIIVTAGGKNIAPAKIENMLINTPYVENAMVLGDNQKFISALLVINTEALISYAENQKINHNLPNFYSHPIIQKAIHESVQSVNRQLPPHEQIRKYRLITENVGMDMSLMTPTMKLKKHKLSEKFGALIQDMYSER